jgi:hypothetical protein
VCRELALFGSRELPGHLSTSHNHNCSILRGASTVPMLTLPVRLDHERSLPLQLAQVDRPKRTSSPSSWIKVGLLCCAARTVFSPLFVSCCLFNDNACTSFRIRPNIRPRRRTTVVTRICPRYAQRVFSTAMQCTRASLALPTSVRLLWRGTSLMAGSLHRTLAFSCSLLPHRIRRAASPRYLPFSF